MASRNEVGLRHLRSYLRRKSTSEFIKQLVMYTILAMGTGFILIPFLWMISTSLKLPHEVWRPGTFLPETLHFENYIYPFVILPFTRFLRNSLIIVALNIIGLIVSCTIVGYGFARYQHVKGNRTLFVVLLATMMLPGQVTLIPQFILFRNLGWFDTFYPLIVPAFFATPFYVFLLRQFFMGIPRELEEAAYIDGAGVTVIILRIIVPLAKPAIATVIIFEFLAKWNDFFGPLIYLDSMENYTLALGLQFFESQYSTEYGPMMAIATLMMVPCIAIFFYASKYFIQGINLTSFK